MKVENSEENGELASKAMPKDAHVMASILSDMGISEWEPRVINQLLEFSYNYVTSVLEDAKMLSGHARKKNIDVEDVRLAVQMYSEQNVTSPPPRDVLLEVARTKNSSSLPIPKPNCGLRLPPDRFCLSSCNYKLKAKKKHQQPRPYYYGPSGSSAMMVPKNKIMMGPPQSGQIPTFTMTPQGGLNQMRPVVKMAPTANKIQIQPSGGPTVFTMTINPNKRKADE